MKIKKIPCEREGFVIPLMEVGIPLFTLAFYESIGTMHKKLEKFLRILLEGLINFISPTSSCGLTALRGC